MVEKKDFSPLEGFLSQFEMKKRIFPSIWGFFWWFYKIWKNKWRWNLLKVFFLPPKGHFIQFMEKWWGNYFGNPEFLALCTKIWEFFLSFPNGSKWVSKLKSLDLFLFVQSRKNNFWYPMSLFGRQNWKF